MVLSPIFHFMRLYLCSDDQVIERQKKSNFEVAHICVGLGTQLHPQYSVSGCRQRILHSQYSGRKHAFHDRYLQHRRSCSITKFCNTLGNITLKVASKHIKSIRSRFYHSFISLSESWNLFSRAPTAPSGLGLCAVRPQIQQRSKLQAAKPD